MINHELYIDGQLMDISPSEDITITYNSNLFRDVSKMLSNTTYTIRLPRTIRNAKVFGNADKVSSESNFPTTYHAARYYRNGVCIFDNGFAVLLSVSDAFEVSIAFGLFSSLQSVISNGLQLNQLQAADTIQYDINNDAEDYDTAIARGYFYPKYTPFANEHDDTWVGGMANYADGGWASYALADGVILTGAIGATIPTTPVARSGMSCAVFSFLVGDTLFLQNAQGQNDALTWCIIDSTNTVILTASDASYIASTTIHAPSTSAMCIINTSTTAIVDVAMNRRSGGGGTWRVDLPSHYYLPAVSVNWVLDQIEGENNLTFNFGTDAQDLIDSLCLPCVTRKALQTGSVMSLDAEFTDLPNTIGTLRLKLNQASPIFSESPNVNVNQLTAILSASIEFDIQYSFSWDTTTSEPNVGEGHTRYHNGSEVISPRYIYYLPYIEMRVAPGGDDDNADVYLIGDEHWQDVPYTNYDSMLDENGLYWHILYGTGRIDIESGDVITFVKKNYLNSALYNETRASSYIRGSVDTGDEVQHGMQFPIVANLPEIKVTDFLKFLSAITATYPHQSSSSVIDFLPFDVVFDHSRAVDWSSKVIQSRMMLGADTTEYKYSDFAQKNWYRWKEDESVLGSYDGCMEIQNETLDAEREYVFPFCAADGDRLPLWTPKKKRGLEDTEWPTFKGCDPRIMTMVKDAADKMSLTFDINMQTIINDKYGNIASSLAKTMVIKEKMVMSDVELSMWDDSRPVYLKQYGAYFAVLSIESHSDGIASVTLLRLSGATEPTPPEPPTPVLPYDAEIEYLENTGTQWIDTNYIPNPSTLEFEIKYQINAVTTSAGSMFGSRKYNGSHYDIIQLLTLRSGSTRYRFDYNATATNLQNYDANVHIIKLSGGHLTIDGNQMMNVNLTAFDALKLFVFATNQNGEVTLIHQGYKLYYFKFGALDLIPVRVGQVGMMYDRVSGELFGNDGTGDFILGNDKN